MIVEARAGGQNPSETSRVELGGLEQALREGNKLHGFLSGGGLRVIRLESPRGKLRGYGEHPHVDEALIHASEDFLAGHRRYGDVYGKIYLQYLTGSQETTSPLDAWLLRGRTVDAHQNPDGRTVVVLNGYTNTDIPQDRLDYLKTVGGRTRWSDGRGYVYETTYSRIDDSYSTTVVFVPEGKKESRAFFYKSTKTGEGQNFTDALNQAFQTPSVEKVDLKA